MKLGWEVVEKRWLPLVEEMERLGFDDYAEPEIYRAASRHIEQLESTIEHGITSLTIQMSKTIRHLIKEFPVTCWFTEHKKMGEYDFNGDCGEPATAIRQGIPVCDEHA